MNIAVYQQMLSAYAQSQMRSHSICGSSDFLELFLLIKKIRVLGTNAVALKANRSGMFFHFNPLKLDQ